MNREKAYYQSGGGPEKSFHVGSIDHLEDAIRRVSSNAKSNTYQRSTDRLVLVDPYNVRKTLFRFKIKMTSISKTVL